MTETTIPTPEDRRRAFLTELADLFARYDVGTERYTETELEVDYDIRNGQYDVCVVLAGSYDDNGATLLPYTEVDLPRSFQTSDLRELANQ